MKILWLSANKGLYQDKQSSSDGYNGGGWISSLQKLLITSEEHTLALAFITSFSTQKEKQNKTTYYPIFTPPKNPLQKFKEYYGGYKKITNDQYNEQIKKIIHDFNPDIIHLFGLENPLACILGNTNIPIIVHIQGLLAPCDNAFFPVSFNKSSFLFPFSLKEWVFRNGYIFAKNNIHIRGKKEICLFKKTAYFMGRTKWDYQVSQFFSPQAQYFHVDEVLRDSFYENAGKWEYPQSKELKIISTLSNTIYKGLDTILKAAQLLKQEGNIPFKWQIVGISPEDSLITFFERKLKIISKNVNIEYIGILNAKELCNNLLKCHIYVHPSYIDNSPNSVCEAQLIGIPTIGTYVGGIPSLIENEENGLLIPSNAPFELAYLLKKCFSNKDFVINIGRKGYLTAAQRHNKTKILENLLNTYSCIINKKDSL